MYISILSIFMSVCHMLATFLQRPEEGVRSPGTAVIELLVIISVLGIEPRFSGRATSALNCWAISLVLMSFSCVHTLSHLIRVTCMNIGRDLLLELGQLTSTTVLWNMTTLLYQPLAAYNSSGWRGVS